MATKYVENSKGNCRLCRDPDREKRMITCQECFIWFHVDCVGLEERPKDQQWTCPKCTESKGFAQQIWDLNDALARATALLGKEEAKVKDNISKLEDQKRNESAKINGSSDKDASPNTQQELAKFLKRQALMELPRFNGLAKEWPRFKSIFEQTTREGGFNDLENLNRLLKVLNGSAAKVVHSLMMDPANVSRIMIRLEETFGMPEVIFRELVQELKRIKKDQKGIIIEISDALDNLVSNMKALNKASFLKDHRLIQDIVQKLPYPIQVKWAEALRDNVDRNEPTLEDLNRWLLPHSKTTRMLTAVVQSKEQEAKQHRLNLHQLEKQKNKQQNKCIICTGNHTVFGCQEFRRLNVQERNALVKQRNLCFNCLDNNHRYTQCKRTYRCKVPGCGKKHNSLLHEKTTIAESNVHQCQRHVYYQILPITLVNGSKKFETHAFLDQGSSLTLIDEEVANRLGVRGTLDTLRLKWTQDISNECPSKKVSIMLRGPNGRDFTLNNVRTVPNLQLPVQTVRQEDIKKHFPNIKNFKGYQNANPKILIGLDHSDLLLALERKGKNPYMIRTKLGWTVMGSTRNQTNIEDQYSFIIDEAKIEKQLQQYFKIEDFGVKVPANLPKSKDEKRVNDIIKNTLKYIDGRYEIGLFWKQDCFSFPPSYNNALNRLISMENKLIKNPALKEWAINTFEDYLRKGYIRKLTEHECDEHEKRVFYLPHFVVVNKNKQPPKPRLVFDAAATIRGTSLNSTLLSGPDATASLFGILLRFREGRYAITGDIKEMFHQVRIRPEDQHAQRFLWRDCDQNKQPESYVMQVMTFGSTCSPASAQVVKNSNADKYIDEFPDAVEAIKNDHYIDDYVKSFDTRSQAIKVTDQVIRIHNEAGFYIRNFISNSNSILNELPKERVQESQTRTFEDKESSIEKILGIYWNTKTDAIAFNINMNKLAQEVLCTRRLPTKRELLAFVMSIYDPLGLIADKTIHGKLLLQTMHREVPSWDNTLPVKYEQKWYDWIDTLKRTENISIPRHTYAFEGEIIELHTFVDASEEAYAACVYLRSKLKDKTKVSLLCAKTKVAPIRTLSIPRLELQAAMLGTRLQATVLEQLSIKPARSIIWSDSQTVLAWIKSDQRKYKQFVSIRIGEILEATKIDQWRWVPTNLNPADEATKEKMGNSIWINGPSFLQAAEESWPKIKNEIITDEELRFAGLHEEDFTTMVERYSKWDRLIQHLCIWKKFIEWLRNKRKEVSAISMVDRIQVESAVIRHMQAKEFADEIKDIRRSGQVMEKSKIANLSPVLDKNGLLRCDGRLAKSSIPDAPRFPIILAKKSHVTQLIIDNYHEKYWHQGDNVVIASLLLRYYVPAIRRNLNQVKSNCMRCLIRHAKPSNPQMGTIPDAKLDVHAYPFTHTGVDYFGPLEVSVKRSIEKRWGVIFTCMTTRAVHLELANKLSTDAFFTCFRNFQNRRGKVMHMYSDNGTNFVGANKELKELIDELNERMGRGVAVSMEVDWTFNPPGAPHFGGSWERLIRIIKNCLSEMLKAYKDTRPTPEVLQAALIQAEFFLNSRPLTYIPVDNPGDEVITPFHFLIGRAGKYVPPFSPNLKPFGHGELRRAQHYAKFFWDKWKQEYLPTLIPRNKWTNKIEPMQKGDIVLSVDESKPPGSWKRGIVHEVYPDKHGQVRVADVVFNGKLVTKRPVVKLAVLDIRNKEGQTQQSEEPHSVMVIDQAPESTKRKGEPVVLPEYGKRKSIDMDKVLEIRDKLKKENFERKVKKKSKIRPYIPPPWVQIMLLFYCIATALGLQSAGIIAYDCANADVNITSYSLLEVASCVPQNSKLESTEEMIQVLQRNAKTQVKVTQCKVIIQRSIRHCGMHSHTSDYENSYAYIVKEFNAEECFRSHLLGSVALSESVIIRELPINATTRGESLVAGRVHGSDCDGETYRTPTQVWTKALVYYQYEITLNDYTANVDIENDQIQLRKGLTCTFSAGKCLDAEEGYLTWDVNLNKRCEDTEFEVIFEGMVNKTRQRFDGKKHRTITVYTTISDAHLFSIKTKDTTRICGYNGYTTDHPRIFILETSNIRSPFSSRGSSPKNYDIFTYFNSKITFVESYFGQKLNEAYYSIISEMCKLDKQLMETKLTLARLNPTEFVASITKEQGYTAIVAGETLYILKCKPVYVIPRPTKRCYQEIPANYNNVSVFIAPVTRVLQRRGTEIDCTPLISAKFMFGGRWYTVDDKFRETTSPNKLSTEIVTAWTYTSLPSLMRAGVYDTDSVEKMRNMIYEQGDRRIASSVLHRLLTNQSPNIQGFKFETLVSEDIVEGIIDKYWRKLLTWSTWLGNISATAIGIYMIIRVTKFFVDTLVHGQILYDIYGVGWQLIASVWDSLTNLLTHRHHRERAAFQPPRNPSENVVAEPEEEHAGEEPQSRQHPQQYRKEIYPNLRNI